MALLCIIMRSNRTLKLKKVGLRKDSFNFEDGVYFINSDRVCLKKNFLFGHKPVLLYKEGISQPLGFNDIIKKQKEQTDKDGKVIKDKKGNAVMIDDETILIDARSLHKLASEHILGFLTRSSTKKLLMAIIIISLFTLIITIGVNINV